MIRTLTIMENIGRCDRSASFSFYAHGHPDEVCQQKLMGARRRSSGIAQMPCGRHMRPGVRTGESHRRERWDMEYHKKADLKVECVAAREDFDFFGITLDDVLDRTEAGMYFLKKAKELCAMTQGVEWTNVAYTLNITMLPDDSVSFEFSERIEDYVVSLKHSLAMAGDETRGALEEFIAALEGAGEEEGRRLVAHFEKNIKAERMK